MAGNNSSWKRFIPIAIIVLLMAVAYFAGIGDYLTQEQLKQHRAELKQLVEQHPVAAPLAYIAIYTTATALSVPGALFLTLIGGFLFAQPMATVYVVFSATTGAIAIFLAAKTALGPTLKEKVSGKLGKMRDGFNDDAISYLLFLRLVPIFPFWLVNLAPAFFGVPLITFAWTTVVGIIPGSFVFCQAGAGIGAILDSGDLLSVDAILNDQMKIALIALGIFALLPAIIKKIRRKEV